MKHANVAFFVPMVGCPHRCSFCDQLSITGESGIPTPEEVDQTLAKAAKDLRKFCLHSEVAFFGGSFTMLPEKLMRSLLEPAYKYVRRMSFTGIRISTRPDAINEHILSVLAEYGVSAIELGAQSSDDEILAKNLRGHTFEDTKRACELIRKAGFDLGLQMMTGLPGSTREKDVLTAAQFAALKPDTMRIYPALVLKNTLMAEWYEKGEYTPQTVDEAADLCAELMDIFELYKINVIRVGLHAERSLEESLIAGPYHPAFCEIAESIRFRKKMEFRISRMRHKKFAISVCEKYLSKCVGHHRCNMEYWKSKGFDVEIRIDNSLKPGEFYINVNI